MLGALIIVFREVIEAGLIVGIVLAVDAGRARPRRYGSAEGVVAGVARRGPGRRLRRRARRRPLRRRARNCSTPACSPRGSCSPGTTSGWRATAANSPPRLRKSAQAVAEGSRAPCALAIVVAVAVLREGSEVVLFLYGLVIAGGSSTSRPRGRRVDRTFAGVRGERPHTSRLVRIPGSYLFGVTTVLITFLAAGLAAQSVVFLQQAGLVTALERTVWDTSGVLSDTSLIGRVLHTLVGYTDQPSGMQLVVYLFTLIAIFGLDEGAYPRRRPQRSR